MFCRGLPVFAVLFVVASDAACAEKKPCIGRIIIVGNEYTPAWFIHDLVGLHTGDRLVFPEVRIAERNLSWSGRFLIDPQKGIRPTVRTFKENDRGPVVDIVITVHERPWNACWPAGFDATAYRCVGYTRYYSRMTADVLVDTWDSLADRWSSFVARVDP